MQFHRDQYLDLMTFGRVERPMFVELFGLDHRIPNGTPLENYRYYVDLGREILALPPRTPERKGWRRMGF